MCFLGFLGSGLRDGDRLAIKVWFDVFNFFVNPPIDSINIFWRDFTVVRVENPNRSGFDAKATGNIVYRITESCTRGSQVRKRNTSGLPYKSCMLGKLFVFESSPLMSTAPAKCLSSGVAFNFCFNVTCEGESLASMGAVNLKSLFASELLPAPFCPNMTKVGFSPVVGE